MKKIITIALFVLGFIETYLIMSFYIPSLRLKLIAPPLEFFLKSLASTWLFKFIISIIVGLIISGIYVLLIKKKKDTKGLMFVVAIFFMIVVIGVLYVSTTANRF